MDRKNRYFWSALFLAVAMLAAPVAMAVTTPPPAPPNPLFPPGIGFNPVVDYTKPNFAQSPNIRKFIDSLPGLGAANQNNLKQYIPVAVPDKTSYPGSDYYELGLKQFNQQMNSDLPPSGTALRGYYQKNGPDPSLQYLGVAIIANRDRPVRLKFFNELGTGSSGDLPLPVDTGVMGAGMGPTGANYTQNRATIHLHGGLTPWISDGTPHQWITPAGDPTPYQKGASFQNVPDMVNGSVVTGINVPCIGGTTCFTSTQGDGIATYFYPNQQSSRLMFYHDHAYGITRLNVYAGEAAPYLLVDPVEEDLIAGTNGSGKNSWGLTQILPDQSGLDKSGAGLYRYGIPLVIQDKAFVNDATTPSAAAKAVFPDPVAGYAPTPPTLTTDPLWQYYVGTAGGNLWLPHEYMPIENIYDPSGNTSNGRWDYAPFMNPPMIPTHLTLPSPTIVPESFGDTAVINGTAFPFLELPPDTVRFRILNASNDRSLNLQLYKADPLRINVTNGGTGYTTPVVAITGNAGTYTSATAVVSPGTVASINVVGATHYVFPPTVTLTNAPGDTGTCSSVTATIPSNTSGTLDITASGCTGFTAPPTVTIAGGGGGTYTSASATIIPKGVITAIVVNGATGYRSDLPAPTVTITDSAGTGANASAVALVNTEVKMVDAAPNSNYPTWPTDGRDGGVPDPTTSAPPWIQIGNEAGLLAQAVVLPQQPIDYEYTRQNLPTLGVTSHSLLLMSAMRADVILDLRGYKDGDTLIMYNDAPAAMPGFWQLNDYYTDSPDLTGVGGAPSIPPGVGPNTRTLMQIRIKGTKASSFNFDLNSLKAALPKAFAASQDKPLVPQLAYNDAYPGFATFDTYAQNYFDTLNLTGTAQQLARIKTTVPGNNYVTAPTVTIVGGGGTGARATAGLNPCGGLTLLTTGSGYTSPPTVTIGAPGANGVQATAVATISGGVVNAITIDEPGSNYSTTVAPTCTITGGGGTGATCSAFVAAANTVGSIRVTNPGTGYTSQPYVYLTGGSGQGAMAVAMLNGSKVFTGKNLTEGFDPDYGRMDIRLGSTPNPLTPNVGNGMVIGISRYIDPPTELLNDGETILWRLTHLGVDSHSMHFHLFNMQVVNRVDWTNVVKPPYPDEIGWRETIRTNPMEDIIVAIQPKSMNLPFPIPKSSRLLDVTTPVNSTTNFLPVPPPPGIGAVPQVSNVVTDFSWEYVWHCHLLGHEENDMMRPLVLLPGSPVAAVAPPSLTFPAQVVGTPSPPLTVQLSNTATVGQPLFISNITITGANSGDFTQTNTCGPSLTFGTNCAFSVTFTPSGANARTASLTMRSTDPARPTITIPLSGTGVASPAAPSNLTANIASTSSITLNWTDNSNNETSFAIWRSINGAAFTQVGSVARTGTGTTGTGGTVTYTDSGLTLTGPYAYYVTAVNIAGPSAPTATVTVTAPATPTALTATVASGSSIGLTWTDNSNSETSFAVWSAVNGGAFSQIGTVARTGTAITGTGGTVSYTHTGLTTGNTYSYYVTASNLIGTSLPTATINITLSSTALPPPWATMDVGSVGLTGNARFLNGLFTLQGAGADIWGTADAFRFVYQPLSGDGQITARVASMQNTSAFAKTGVMIRESLTANSTHAMMDVTPGNGAEFSRRLSTGASTTVTALANVTAPYWVRLVRTGNTLTGYVSANGTTWVQAGTSTVAMASSVYIGLVVSSHTTTALATSTIDNVSVTGATGSAPTAIISAPISNTSFLAPASIPITATATAGTGATVRQVDFYSGVTLIGTATTSPYTVTWSNVSAGSYSLTVKVTDTLGATATSSAVPITVTSTATLPAPWVTADVGTVGLTGSVGYLNGVFTVQGAGADIWGTADAFRYVYKPLTGNGQLIARVGSLQNTSAFAKAGVMIRQSLTANSMQALMDVTPGNGAEFSRRTTTGGTTTATAGNAAAPYWVKIVRSGNTFTGSISADGVTWVQVGTATIAMTNNAYIGLFVTSHNTAALSSATFDNVQ
jgi:FtsP/CotA-like multicopper oxidase with cupredoxin domain/regulation of enolase protein 1 (concanavalin A-like superfamily)